MGKLGYLHSKDPKGSKGSKGGGGYLARSKSGRRALHQRKKPLVSTKGSSKQREIPENCIASLCELDVFVPREEKGGCRLPELPAPTLALPW